MNAKKRQRSTNPSVRNDILPALLDSEYHHLSPKLERVDLKRDEIICRTDQRINCVYVPETSVVAMIDTMEDAATVEVGMIGHEGMVGINIFLHRHTWQSCCADFR
jgi:hypothetical protein